MENRIVFLDGPRVYFRPPMESDLPLFVRWMNDSEGRRYLMSHLPMTETDERKWLERATSEKPKSISLVMVLKDGDKPIGTMGLVRGNDKDNHATTGTLIGEGAERGKGYAPEAKMVLLNYAFNTLNVRKVYSYVFAPNTQSIRALEKCGYKPEATIPEDSFVEGAFVAKHVYAVYQRDWEPLWKKFLETHPKPW